MLKSAVLYFKIFEGSTTGERIYEDVVAVLQKYQGETEDTIVFDTIGITDTTGNMGKLGNTSAIMEKNMATVLTTICIWLQDWHLIVRYHEIFVCSATTVSFMCHLISFGNTLYLSFPAPTVPTVAVAMKKARDIVQYFNKLTQATKKLKDQQHESLLPKYSGQPKNIF